MSRTNVVVHRGRRTVGFLEAPGDRSLCPLAVLSPRAREHPGPLLGPIPLPRRSRASSGRVATTAHTIRRADASTVYLRDWRRPRAVPRADLWPRTAPSAPQDTTLYENRCSVWLRAPGAEHQHRRVGRGHTGVAQPLVFTDRLDGHQRCQGRCTAADISGDESGAPQCRSVGSPDRHFRANGSRCIMRPCRSELVPRGVAAASLRLGEHLHYFAVQDRDRRSGRIRQYRMVRHAKLWAAYCHDAHPSHVLPAKLTWWD